MLMFVLVSSYGHEGSSLKLALRDTKLHMCAVWLDISGSPREK